MNQAADAFMGIFGMKRVKPRKCSYCKAEFLPSRMGQKVCSPECAYQIAKNKREKVERAADRVKKESLLSRSQWLKKAQAAFNKWIRERDFDQPCISCGVVHRECWDAGHYRSVGSNPALRFHPDNCHKQCIPCNQHKHGNAVEYRIGLEKRIGPERLAFLEGPHEPRHYSIPELKAICEDYKKRAKDLKADREKP